MGQGMHAEGSDASSHGHVHSHAVTSRKLLSIALTITGIVLIAELIGAYVTGSLSLAADAGHMAVDSSSLVIALIAASLMTRPADDRRSWGWARSEIIAAAVQAGMLIIISGIVAWEAVGRLLYPEDIDAVSMGIVGVVGLVANIASILVLSSHRGASLNMKAAFLEVLNDALGSVAVIVSAVVAYLTQWSGADAVASLVIAGMMVPRAVVLLRRSVSVLMENAPEEIDVDEVREHIVNFPGVRELHDLHISTIATGLVTLSAHVVVEPTLTCNERDTLVHTVQECLASHFSIPIGHATIQVDSPTHYSHEQLTH